MNDRIPRLSRRLYARVRIRRPILLVSLGCMISGCETVARANDLQERTDRIERTLSDRFGGRPTLRWSVVNGTFRSMEIFLPPEQVARYTVAELQDSVAAILRVELETMPGTLIVGVVAGP